MGKDFHAQWTCWEGIETGQTYQPTLKGGGSWRNSDAERDIYVGKVLRVAVEYQSCNIDLLVNVDQGKLKGWTCHSIAQSYLMKVFSWTKRYLHHLQRWYLLSIRRHLSILLCWVFRLLLSYPSIKNRDEKGRVHHQSDMGDSHCDSQTQPNIHSQPNKCPTSQMCLYVSVRHSSGWNSTKAYLKQCPPTVVPRTDHEYNTA